MLRGREEVSFVQEVELLSRVLVAVRKGEGRAYGVDGPQGAVLVGGLRERHDAKNGGDVGRGWGMWEKQMRWPVGQL